MNLKTAAPGYTFNFCGLTGVFGASSAATYNNAITDLAADPRKWRIQKRQVLHVTGVDDISLGEILQAFDPTNFHLLESQ